MNLWLDGHAGFGMLKHLTKQIFIAFVDFYCVSLSTVANTIELFESSSIVNRRSMIVIVIIRQKTSKSNERRPRWHQHRCAVRTVRGSNNNSGAIILMMDLKYIRWTDARIDEWAGAWRYERTVEGASGRRVGRTSERTLRCTYKWMVIWLVRLKRQSHLLSWRLYKRNCLTIIKSLSNTSWLRDQSKQYKTHTPSHNLDTYYGH